MINALWCNSQELNGNGTLQRIIALGAAVTAGANASLPAIERRRGLKASSSAGASAQVQAIARQRTLASNALAGAAVSGATFSPVRNMAAEAYVLTDSFLGGSFPIFLEADVTAGASGELYPFDKFFDGDVSAGASATADLTKTQFLGGTASTNVTTDAASTAVQRRAFAQVLAGAEAIANPDSLIGGIRHADLGGIVQAGADAENTIDPKKALYAIGAVNVSAGSLLPMSKAIVLLSNPQVAGSSGVMDPPLAHVTLRANAVSAGASAQSVRLSRKAMVYGDSTAGAGAEPKARISVASFLEGLGVAGIPATAVDVYRNRTLGASVLGGADTSAPLLDEAEKLFGAGEAGADVEMSGYFTTRTLGAVPTMAGATANVQLLVNLYEDEPDFRTLIVEPEDWTATVDPEDWTIYISDDVTPMKTFEKQPADVLPYDIDFTEWFEQIPKDEIETATCSVVSATDGNTSELVIGSIVQVSETPSGPVKRVKVWTSGGLDGVTYKLTLTMVSEDGRTKEVDFKIKVKEL